MKTLVATFHTPEALMRAAVKTKADGFPQRMRSRRFRSMELMAFLV